MSRTPVTPLATYSAEQLASGDRSRVHVHVPQAGDQELARRVHDARTSGDTDRRARAGSGDARACDDDRLIGPRRRGASVDHRHVREHDRLLRRELRRERDDGEYALSCDDGDGFRLRFSLCRRLEPREQNRRGHVRRDVHRRLEDVGDRVERDENSDSLDRKPDGHVRRSNDEQPGAREFLAR